jgi:hypothetical protein
MTRFWVIAVSAVLATGLASAALAQSYPAGTKVKAVYQGSVANTQELTGTIDGQHLRMATTYYVNGSEVDMTVDGTLNGKTLTYTIKFAVSAYSSTCTATGSATADFGEIKIPLDNMQPDNNFCHQSASAGYRRNMTIQLPTS